MAEKDVEGDQPTKIPHFRQVFDQAGITPEVQEWEYDGSGTEEDPYIVTWIENDPRNPMAYSALKKWGITMMVAFATLAVAFVSSAYSGGDEVRPERWKRSGAIVDVSLIVLFVANHRGVQMQY